MPLRHLALAALLVGTALPAHALDLNAMTDEEREAFRAEVRSYLLENPEVLTEAISVLQQREQEQQIEADEALVRQNMDAIANDGHSWVGGNPDGDVTVVEFMDYRCHYCRQAFQEVEDLVSGDGNVRFILKEFPILGPQSDLSSRFAIAVQQLHGADVYKDVHDALMLLQADADEGSLTKLAESFDLDPAPIFDRMDSPEVQAVIDENHALAQTLGISGTPTFVFGDQMVRGYVPLNLMQGIVEEERAG
ncbi:Protein-disulfide isomerase [Rubellimicrobium mesophilum DSM 19309]|uniref:Protein-disulfide isomerase n=1 Tax=Rubellimicrobium mesophilum DSM 19309 TaxID=442562 RepID=A0A017HN95_9RHOB|nr:DsbA family protein [Rubellimicrobium mesophilum]EYD75795.1 Protein-disulfide isomerase [Rubellimicrobium mesophilum DSM 19309]